ncbi:hypothetical protein [Brevundimonas sp. Leaf363]|uniref:hypothetical protein n=1 Tax=Brevundimonas sp. Leaf363 TaxID=1736353 RepID=UPI0012E1E8AA|nr:hypothetical protein [Brevundimonas sp. Leaf363]
MIFLGLVVPYCWGGEIPLRLANIGIWFNPITYFAAYLISFGSAPTSWQAVALGTLASFILAFFICTLCMVLGRVSKLLLAIPLALFLWYSIAMSPIALG